MPVSGSISQVYTITSFRVDLVAMSLVITMSRTVGGVVAAPVEFNADPVDVQGFLNSDPDGSTTRLLDWTNAIYNYAITKGWITGTLS
jgi:hypothetical protein